MQHGNVTANWTDYVPRAAGRAPAARIMVLEDFASPQLGNRRNILVCLPPSYERSVQRYPVLYMQDGQNLFDRATSYAEEWRADDVLMQVAAEGREAIIVGVSNAGRARVDEYSPFRDPKLGGGRGREYLAFLTDTVKPEVDRAFRTMPDPQHTGVAGSSMGGLFSLFATFERPDVFAFAGAMSPALWFSRRAVFAWLERHTSGHGRLYIDAGTGEGPVVLADVARLRDVLLDRGYRLGRDLEFVLETGGHHDERAWGRRLHGMLRFMLA